MKGDDERDFIATPRLSPVRARTAGPDASGRGGRLSFGTEEGDEVGPTSVLSHTTRHRNRSAGTRQAEEKEASEGVIGGAIHYPPPLLPPPLQKGEGGRGRGKWMAPHLSLRHVGVRQDGEEVKQEKWQKPKAISHSKKNSLSSPAFHSLSHSVFPPSSSSTSSSAWRATSSSKTALPPTSLVGGSAKAEEHGFTFSSLSPPSDHPGTHSMHPSPPIPSTGKEDMVKAQERQIVQLQSRIHELESQLQHAEKRNLELVQMIEEKKNVAPSTTGGRERMTARSSSSSSSVHPSSGGRVDVLHTTPQPSSRPPHVKDNKRHPSASAGRQHESSSDRCNLCSSTSSSSCSSSASGRDDSGTSRNDVEVVSHGPPPTIKTKKRPSEGQQIHSGRSRKNSACSSSILLSIVDPLPTFPVGQGKRSIQEKKTTPEEVEPIGKSEAPRRRTSRIASFALEGEATAVSSLQTSWTDLAGSSGRGGGGEGGGGGTGTTGMERWTGVGELGLPTPPTSCTSPTHPPPPRSAPPLQPSRLASASSLLLEENRPREKRLKEAQEGLLWCIENEMGLASGSDARDTTTDPHPHTGIRGPTSRSWDPAGVEFCVRNGADVCGLIPLPEYDLLPIYYYFIKMGQVGCLKACLKTDRPMDFTLVNENDGCTGLMEAVRYPETAVMTEMVTAMVERLLRRGVVVLSSMEIQRPSRNTASVPCVAPNAGEEGKGKRTTVAPAFPSRRSSHRGTSQEKEEEEGAPFRRSPPLPPPPAAPSTGEVGSAPPDSYPLNGDRVDWLQVDYGGRHVFTWAAQMGRLAMFWTVVKQVPYLRFLQEPIPLYVPVYDEDWRKLGREGQQHFWTDRETGK